MWTPPNFNFRFNNYPGRILEPFDFQNKIAMKRDKNKWMSFFFLLMEKLKFHLGTILWRKWDIWVSTHASYTHTLTNTHTYTQTHTHKCRVIKWIYWFFFFFSNDKNVISDAFLGTFFGHVSLIFWPSHNSVLYLGLCH